MKTILSIFASLALALPAFGASQGFVVRAEDGHSTNQSLTNSTIIGASLVGSNYVTGTTYFGGGNAARFTNGFVTQDSIEIGGDALMLDPGFEFIGTHRGDGQFITNIPQAGVDNLVTDLAGKIGVTNSAGTNIIFYTHDNDPIFTTAPAFTIKPLEKRANGVAGGAMLAYVIEPPYTNDGFGGKFRLAITAITNTLGDPLPDITHNYGYNVAAHGGNDTNEPTWLDTRETRWQNVSALSQLEIWSNFGTPFNAAGTNSSFRYMGFNLNWGMATKTYDSSDGNITVDSFYFGVPQVGTTPGNGLPAIRFAKYRTNSMQLRLQQESQITFDANTHPDGQFIVDAQGELLAGRTQYGMSAFGTPSTAKSNAIVLMPGTALAGASPAILLGASNSYTGFRWNHLSNRLEYAVGSPAALGSIVWKKIPDVSDGSRSLYISTSVTATNGDYRNLFTVTNTAGSISAMIQLDVTAFRTDGVARYLIPVLNSDAISTTWKEVLAIAHSTNATFAIDVAGIADQAAKVRIRNTGSNALANIRITATVFSLAGFIELLDTSAGAITQGGTVASLYRHSALTQVTGKVGIGTNNPQSTLHVVGNATVSGITNLATTDAIVYADSAGNYSEATAANIASPWTGSGTYMTRFGTNADPSGAGDVVAAGDNVLTGDNVFNGSNYLTGTTYFGGGNAIRLTNGAVLFDGVEQYAGDYVMIDPGSEFIGTFRGNGLFLTNTPITGLQGSGGSGDPATNGTPGQALLSAGNGGVYWGTASGGTSGALTNNETRNVILAGATNHMTGDFGIDGNMTMNGLTITGDLVAGDIFGLITSGNVTNAAGSRVAYLSDVSAAGVNYSGGHPTITVTNDSDFTVHYPDGKPALWVDGGSVGAFIFRNYNATPTDILQLNLSGSVFRHTDSFQVIVNGNSEFTVNNAGWFSTSPDDSTVFAVDNSGVSIVDPDLSDGDFLYYIASGGLVKGTNSPTVSNLTVTGAATIGLLTLGTNPGKQPLIDATVTSASANGTEHGSSIRLDGNEMLNAVGVSDQNGGTTNLNVTIPTGIQFRVNAMYMPSNAISQWPPAPKSPGDAYWGNSNGVIYLLTSDVGMTWVATNKIAP